MTDPSTGLRLVKKAKRVTEIAQHLGITTQAVSRWKRQIPHQWVLRLEELTGISRHDQRPDVFGPRPKRGRAA